MYDPDRTLLAEPVSPIADIPENASFELSGKRILLVEDNELNREIATEILEEEGMIVDTAEDKENAVAAGMNGHIAKPIDVPKLLNTLAGILN